MYINWPCFTAMRATVAPIMKKDIKPFARDTLVQSLFIETQLKIKKHKAIAKERKTQMNTPISNRFILVYCVSEFA